MKQSLSAPAVDASPCSSWVVPGRRGVARTVVLVVMAWAALVALVTLLGWAITHPWQGTLDPWDNDASRWFAGHRSDELDRPADVGTLLGDTLPAFAFGGAVVLAIAVWRRTWRPLVFFGLVANH